MTKSIVIFKIEIISITSSPSKCVYVYIYMYVFVLLFSCSVMSDSFVTPWSITR